MKCEDEPEPRFIKALQNLAVAVLFDGRVINASPDR